MDKIPNNTITKEQISIIAKRAVAWSLADLNLVIQNAIRLYTETHEVVGLNYTTLIEAFESFHDGEEKKHFDEQALIKTAYHEAGHAILANVLAIPIVHTTIVSRKNYGGYVQFGDENKTDYSKRELLDRIAVYLAGRASEVLFFGSEGITTGASADIKSASGIAENMVCEYGMDETSIIYLERNNNIDLAQSKAKAQLILKDQYERAQKLVTVWRCAIEAAAQELLAKNNLSEGEVKDIVNKYKHSTWAIEGRE